MKERDKSQSKNKKGGLRAQSQKIKASLLKSYYGNPTKDMKLVAITGTTGKTTVAHYVHEILKATGEQVAVFASDQPYKLGTLHKFLSDAWKAGAKGCTVYRENSRAGVLVSATSKKKDSDEIDKVIEEDEGDIDYGKE